MEKKCYLCLRLVNLEGKLDLLLPRKNDGFIELLVMEDLQGPVWGKMRRNCFEDQMGRPLGGLLALYSANAALTQGFFEVSLCRSRPSGTAAVMC
ncbi:hypothetical protein CDL15_Pgr009075 [Punica granatum]|uniref:Uncharacterized protein n=1 Tax=Punica granatum TaxID=22663 RepID=A0A218VYC0_PUNGR|nr:hypothetical protein CDL15_Pgr009075 [Punica granatum]PKI53296.1 hypothetical protein CRG98_026324 [Punica granatum]